MSVVEMVGAALGFMLIAAVIWNLRHGIPEDNGKQAEPPTNRLWRRLSDRPGRRMPDQVRHDGDWRDLYPRPTGCAWSGPLPSQGHGQRIGECRCFCSCSTDRLNRPPPPQPALARARARLAKRGVATVGAPHMSEGAGSGRSSST